MNTENNQFYQPNGQCDSNTGACGPDGQTLNDQQKTGAGMNQAKETQEQINKYVIV